MFINISVKLSVEAAIKYSCIKYTKLLLIIKNREEENVKEEIPKVLNE